VDSVFFRPAYVPIESPRLMFVLLRPTILAPVSMRATSVGTFFSNIGSFFILLKMSLHRLVAASPRAEGDALVSASRVACSVTAPESQRSVRRPSSCRLAAAPLTSFCASWAL
jgi:hypothetical protein